MENTVSRLQLNAHLIKLTEGWDKQTAKVVVDSFHHLPVPPSNRRVVRITSIKDDAPVSGYTKEMGDVSTSHREIKDTIHGEKEEEQERVGQFKVSRYEPDDKEFSLILFRHFWEADVATRGLGEPNPVYAIEYHADTLEPYALLVLEWVETERDMRSLPERLSSWLHDIRRFLQGYQKSDEISWHTVPRIVYGESKVVEYISAKLGLHLDWDG